MYRGEWANSISHLIGTGISLVGASVLITIATLGGDVMRIVSFSIYGSSLFLLYLASTLYHSLQGKAKQIFQKMDHLAIYLLIAGTYTPLALVAIQGEEGWQLFSVIWGLAIAGMTLEFVPRKGPRVLPVIMYVVMGWSCLFVMDSLTAAMTPAIMGLLISGGLIYSLGLIFYVLGKRYPFCHAIWHGFVLAGSACHYFAIFNL